MWGMCCQSLLPISSCLFVILLPPWACKFAKSFCAQSQLRWPSLEVFLAFDSIYIRLTSLAFQNTADCVLIRFLDEKMCGRAKKLPLLVCPMGFEGRAGMEQYEWRRATYLSAGIILPFAIGYIEVKMPIHGLCGIPGRRAASRIHFRGAR